MDSDEELDVSCGAKLVDPFDVGKLLKDGCATFELEDEIKDDDFAERAEREKQRKLNKLKIEREYLESQNFELSKDIDGLCDFDEIAAEMGDLTPDGGIKKKILRRGFGPRVTHDTIVYFNYFVQGEGIDEYLDSSFSRKAPARLKMSEDFMLPVFEHGLLSMCVGEESKFLAKPEYYYGKLGCPPRIPPDATVLIFIRVQDVVQGSSISTTKEINMSELAETPTEDLLKAAYENKRYGNDSYKSRDAQEAITLYRKAAKIANAIFMGTDEQMNEKKRITLILYNNIAQCYLDLNNMKKAIEFCRRAIDIDLPKKYKIKSYFRLAKALNVLGQYEEALVHADTANLLDASDPDIALLLKNIKATIKKNQDKEREIARKMFEDVSIESQSDVDPDDKP